MTTTPIAMSLLLAAGLAASAPAMAQDASLAACRDRAAQALPAPVRDVLPAIHGAPGQLLALRSYLRTRDLAARWSWSAERIAAYQRSPEQQQAEAAVARVQARFAADNPGYTLHVNLQVRSLDEQVRKWNGNAAVQAAAQALAERAVAACQARPDGFGDWLRAAVPARSLPLAAPGLSAHGQARVYDFQVQSADALVAGTDTARITHDWIAAGWAARLAQAVHAAGAEFAGPLRVPDEPWHYTYSPPR
jgi:hypothetical protein